MPNERDEGLAINLWDIDRIHPDMCDMLGLMSVETGGKLDIKAGAIRVDRDRPDETAVAFACDLLTAAAILDTIREHDRRAGDYPTRAYIRRARAWVKLAADRKLTTVLRGGGECILNPAIFPPVVERIILPDADPEPLTFGDE